MLFHKTNPLVPINAYNFRQSSKRYNSKKLVYHVDSIVRFKKLFEGTKKIILIEWPRSLTTKDKESLPKPPTTIAGRLGIGLPSLLVLLPAAVLVGLKELVAGGTVLIISFDALQGCSVFFGTIRQIRGCPVAGIGVLRRSVRSILRLSVVVFQTGAGVQVASDLLLDGFARDGINVGDFGHCRALLMITFVNIVDWIGLGRVLALL